MRREVVINNDTTPHSIYEQPNTIVAVATYLSSFE